MGYKSIIREVLPLSWLSIRFTVGDGLAPLGNTANFNS